MVQWNIGLKTSQNVKKKKCMSMQYMLKILTSNKTTKCWYKNYKNLKLLTRFSNGMLGSLYFFMRVIINVIISLSFSSLASLSCFSKSNFSRSNSSLSSRYLTYESAVPRRFLGVSSVSEIMNSYKIHNMKMTMLTCK